MKRTNVLLSMALLLAWSGSSSAEHRGAWLNKVPSKDRAAVNPLSEDPAVVGAGAHLFADHCASCHGEDANGKGNHPSLRTSRIQNATDGELHWLLHNGSLKNGMPSWSSLPDIQRWQLVCYLRSLSNEMQESQ
jgi:mono/diheme cytochrome c family protein